MSYPVRYHSADANLAQYLTEIVISRQARKDGIKLEKGFWRDFLWKKEYANQIQAAHALIKLIGDERIIIQVLTEEMKWVYSLRPKFLRDKMIEAKGKKDKIAKQEEERFTKKEVEVSTVQSSGKKRRVYRG